VNFLDNPDLQNYISMFILETIQAQLSLEMKQRLLDILVTDHLFLSRSSRAK